MGRLARKYWPGDVPAVKRAATLEGRNFQGMATSRLHAISGHASQEFLCFSLERLFTVFISSKEFSIAEYTAFGRDCLGRMIANNPTEGGVGVFDALIAATETCLNGLGDCTGDEATALAVRKARTSANRTLLFERIKGTISSRAGRIADDDLGGRPRRLSSSSRTASPNTATWSSRWWSRVCTSHHGRPHAHAHARSRLRRAANRMDAGERHRHATGRHRERGGCGRGRRAARAQEAVDQKRAHHRAALHRPAGDGRGLFQ